jgi:hypothetical protein
MSEKIDVSAYEKPQIKRVDLVVEETLSVGCKVVSYPDGPCGEDELSSIVDNGS